MTIIEKNLSYKIRGLLIKISRQYGWHFKEELYHNALNNY